MGLIDPIENMLEMRQWFRFARYMPDAVLLDLLQPYVPVEPIDREGRSGVVALYCGHVEAEGIRRVLNDWSERYDREEYEVQCAGKRPRFEEWIKAQELSEATELPRSAYDR